MRLLICADDIDDVELNAEEQGTFNICLFVLLQTRLINIYV